MAVSQTMSKRKESGGRYIAYKKEKQYELGREPSLTKVEKKKRSMKIRTLGNNRKIRLLSIDEANILDPKTKKHKKVKIKTITGSPANKHFVRRNIMTKGAEIDTEMGKAKITSRPGQDGTVNAVLISK
ncbi:MAG: 30S ribosomal protein S8e [Candidatus Woesearchaeota archaeon]|jgi:small subunit ribosomal protein S8e|nr:30S ribosomal protein S8e [Candidatus Woesearchaeota archaeon]|tara:strand:- start:28 stop:414 length:387 start_codon:yes stop_codon:yes gene_type:complete